MIFILKESKFEVVFFEGESRGWSLQLSLLPMWIHVTFSCAWKIWVLCNNLKIKLFCSWGINCDIHPWFSSWFGPVPWGIFKKSIAPVDLNGTLWEICADRYAVVLFHSSWGCWRDGQGHFLPLTWQLCAEAGRWSSAETPWRCAKGRPAAARQDGAGSPRQLKPFGDAGCESLVTRRDERACLSNRLSWP